MDMKNEKDVKAKVKKLLDKHQYFWWMPPANGYGKGGVSDFHAIKRGVFLSVETKFGTNKPTALQVGFLNSIRQESGFAFVVTDRNIAWFETWLQAFDNAAEAVGSHKAVADQDGADMLNAIAALTVLI
jgi:hypothetical protein